MLAGTIWPLSMFALMVAARGEPEARSARRRSPAEKNLNYRGREG